MAYQCVYFGRLRGGKLGGFLALNRWHSKLTVVYVMAACGLIGARLQVMGVA